METSSNPGAGGPIQGTPAGWFAEPLCGSPVSPGLEGRPTPQAGAARIGGATPVDHGCPYPLATAVNLLAFEEGDPAGAISHTHTPMASSETCNFTGLERGARGLARDAARAVRTSSLNGARNGLLLIRYGHNGQDVATQ